MEEIFRAIFDAFPEKSRITFQGKCSDCKDAVTIHVIPTSQGFGLSGGGFVEYSMGKYAVKCSDCYKVNSKMVEYYISNPNILPIFGKKDLLSNMLSAHF
ncbi:MAG: hypothetical protein P8012_12005 [Desulfobacterales bacterium]